MLVVFVCVCVYVYLTNSVLLWCTNLILSTLSSVSGIMYLPALWAGGVQVGSRLVMGILVLFRITVVE